MDFTRFSGANSLVLDPMAQSLKANIFKKPEDKGAAAYMALCTL